MFKLALYHVLKHQLYANRFTYTKAFLMLVGEVFLCLNVHFFHKFSKISLKIRELIDINHKEGHSN